MSVDPILDSKIKHLQSLREDLQFPHIIEQTLAVYQRRVDELTKELADVTSKRDGLVLHRSTLQPQIAAAEADLAAYREANIERNRSLAATRANAAIAASGLSIEELLAALKAQQENSQS